MSSPLEYIRRELSGFYPPDEVKNFARLILRDVCRLSPADIAACKFSNLSDSDVRNIEQITVRLKNYEPFQYIVGQTEFFGMNFSVTPDVLIPRPETEELVEWMLEDNRLTNPKTLDVGTGSGCIAVTLAKKIPGAEVHAWDISGAALAVAAGNAARNGVSVLFNRVDVLSEFPSGTIFDIMVSNPPYVTESEKNDMDKNVVDFEPHVALFVPQHNSLLFYERISDIALRQLAHGGKLFFEINRAKGNEIVAMLKGKGFTEVELRKDLSENDRMIKACKL